MIVYYITSHGYGHAVRSCEVIRNLPPEIPVTLWTAVPEWIFASELAGRPYSLSPARFDCGTLGPDSIAVDLQATIDAAEPLLDANDAGLDAAVAFLRRAGARLVVSDAAGFPLRVARAAGVPSVLETNFTWAAIYRDLIELAEPGPGLAKRARRVVDRLQAEYDQGGLHLVPGLDIPMRACRERRDVPLIARRGQPRRAELAAALGLDPARPIWLLYLGNGGRAGMRWERLGAMDDGRGPLQLIAYAPPPGSEAWVRAIPDGFHHADVTASVDAVIGKPGYSLATECIAVGTPLYYPPRPHFSEGEAIERALAAWGGAERIEEATFLALEWGPHLGRLAGLRAAARPTPCDGGRVIAAELTKQWQAARPLA